MVATPDDAPPPARRARGRRILVRLLALLGGGALALLAAETGLRWLVFGRSELAQRLGRPFREELLYARSFHDEDYWKLQVLLNQDHVRVQPPSPDPLLGWTGKVVPGEYRLRNESLIGDERPVILYGDSNAQCLTSEDDCFQGLMERSELGPTHELLNYGVGGYGLDQIYLLLRESIGHFEGRDPIVIVSFLVDDDLDRSALTFRCWPKPRFRVENGALVEPEPLETDTLAFLEEHPPSIKSYLWRLATVGRTPPGPRPLPGEEEIAERMELNRLLLEAIRNELEARGMQYFFFLFYTQPGLDRFGAAAWSEDVVLRFLEETGAPYVSMRDYIEGVCGSAAPLVGQGPPYWGHLKPIGNRLAFEAMLQGIEGRFGEPDLERAREVLVAAGATEEETQMLDFCGRPAQLRTRSMHACWRRDAGDGSCVLALRAGSAGPTSLEVPLGGASRTFAVTAGAIAVGGEACEATALRLRTRLDEGDWREEALPVGAEPRALELDVRGARRLHLEIACDGPDPRCAWLLLQQLRID